MLDTHYARGTVVKSSKPLPPKISKKKIDTKLDSSPREEVLVFERRESLPTAAFINLLGDAFQNSVGGYVPNFASYTFEEVADLLSAAFQSKYMSSNDQEFQSFLHQLYDSCMTEDSVMSDEIKHNSSFLKEYMLLLTSRFGVQVPTSS